MAGRAQCTPRFAFAAATRAATALACTVLVLLAIGLAMPGIARAQGAGGAQDAEENLACNGATINRALCKPARVCNEPANIAPIQADAGSQLRAARSNTITFTGIPASGATVTYEFQVPRLRTAALTPAGLVQDAFLTPKLTTSGEDTGALSIQQSKALQKTVLPGYTERLDIADQGSTLRVVSYSVRCVPKVEPKTGRLELRESVSPATYSGPGQTLTFTLQARNTGTVPLSAFSLDTTHGTVLSCAPVALGGTLAPNAATTCTARHVTRVEDTASACLTDSSQAQGTTPGGSLITAEASARACLTNARTRALISRFINRRTDLLTSNEPDRARLLGRLRAGGPAAPGPATLTGSGNENAGEATLATSLSQVRARNTSGKAAGEGTDDNPGAMRLGALEHAAAKAAAPLALDVWLEAHYQRWSSDAPVTTRNGDFAIAYLGADYLVTPGLLVGALVQLDFMSDFSQSLGGEVTGAGWMAGPYISAQLSDNLFFDARGAWGTSSNDVAPFGTQSDSFDTQRWLASANLTGTWSFGALRIAPSVGLIYARETQDGFTDSLGLPIESQTAHVGRLTFGPEFSTDIALGGGNVLEPHIGIKGLWDFAKSGETGENGIVTAPGEDLRFKIEGGATLRGESGASIRATASYDGIGAKDFSAWGGQLWFNVPIEALGEEKLFAGLLPECCDGRSYAGASDLQVAQASEAPPPAANDASAPAAPQDEPAYELPSVVVEPAKKAAPAPAAPPKAKPAVAGDDEAAPKSKPKAKKKTADADEPAPAAAKSSSGGGGGGGSGTGSGAGGGTGGGASGGTGAPASAAQADADLLGRAGQRTVEKVASVDIVSAKEIERSGARSLDEAIDLLPGVHVRNAADGVPRIDIRGLRTRSIQLLLDGVPINSAFDGQFDPRAIPVENIARIKVTKGASSVLYGPGGNAAVIDIVTKSAAQGLHSSVQAEWSPQRGTQERVTASYGSKKVQTFMSASGLDQDHFVLSDDFEPTSLQSGEERVNSDRRDRALYANTVWSPSEVAKFGLSVNYRTGEYGKPPATLTRLESDFVPRTRFERVEDFENLSIQSSSWIRFNSQFSIRPMAYFNRSNELTKAYDDATFSTQTRGQTFSEDATTSIGGGGLQALFGKSGEGLTIALDGHNESWSSRGFTIPCQVNASGICLLDGVREDFDTHRDVQVFSAAAEQELKLAPAVSAALGAGYAEQRRSGIISNDYTYLAGLRVEVTDTTALRGSLARKIRFPTLRDLYALDGGNTDLETEVTHNYEVGLEQTLPLLKAALSVALFRIDAENFIQRQNGVFSNVNELQFEGVETSAHYRGIDGLDVSLGYTFLHAENTSPDATTRKVQNEPAHKFTASASYKFDGGLALNADYLYVAGAYAIAGGGDGGDTGQVEALALGSYHVVNVGATQDIPGTTAQLFGRIANLFDEDYVENFGFPQAGRTFFGGMRARY